MNTNTNLGRWSWIQRNNLRATRAGVLPCLVAWLLLMLIHAQNAGAQGTAGMVVFNTHVAGSIVTHVFAPCPTNSTLSVVGNGTADMPSGTVDWSGFTKIGAGGVGGQYGAAGTFAQLLSANGADQPESLLMPESQTTTFRTGAAAGFVAFITATLNNVPPDAPVATIQMVAWDNSSGNYPTWNEALPAWLTGLIAAGKGPVINVTNIGGPYNPPPPLIGLQSFNLYFAPAADVPLIVLQPKNQTVPAGLSLDFTVSAAGSPPLHYQWFFNETNALSGDTNSLLQLAQVQPWQTGAYCAVVSNAFGAVTSAPALLTVTPETYSVLHSFPTNLFYTDVGYWPEVTLVASGTMLYGTTWLGGSSNNGTLFVVDTSGNGYNVVKSFTGGVDGKGPLGLVLSGTTLYGTTYYGGNWDDGTVFKINTDGRGYTVLRSFSDSSSDGVGFPMDLLLSGMTLYGTGSVLFRVNTDGGGCNALHTFGSGTDGAYPVAGLALSGTTLYGTTWLGGTSGVGVLYKVNTDGSGYQVLKNFTRTNSDGYYPQAGPVLSGVTLYGTASWGGTGDRGTVFKVNSDGSGYRVLHNFSGSDGGCPCAELLLCGSVIYGTTLQGGSSDLGTMFQLNTDGSGYTILLDFTGHEGAHPITALVLSGTSLCGMTESGGDYNGGVVFSLALPPPVISQSPRSQTTEAGANVEFSARATGCGLLVYQWFFNDKTVISDATTNSAAVLTNVQVNSCGAYTVVVSNFVGAVTSSPAMLSVIPQVERRLVPGVKVTGATASLLNVDYAASLSPAPNWTTLGSVSLTSTSQYCFDLTLPLPPQRFYRAWQTGTPSVVPSLSLPGLVPAITLTGNIGASLRLDYINQFGPIDAWVTLITVTLTNTSQLYFDVSAPGQPQRLYRIVPSP